ncbi:MAG: lysophospholipid acyltransferase family protein [Rickettsiales bacterium]|nr:lysophospholipid acyltransferase family protein [Rickettsiales bacterium]
MAMAIWSVYFTCWRKIEGKGKDLLRNCRKQPVIFVFWHGRSMMLSPLVSMYGLRGYAIASRHKDGRMMAKLQRLFGLRAIYGSTSEGGISVLRQGVRVLRGKKRRVICMSPDGPSGPSLRVQDGAMYFAKMSGVPIIPVCFSSSGAWFQKRWDRYLVALPFSKITCKLGEPVYIDSKISKKDFEIERKKLEDIMVRQLRDLDAEFNLFKVEQDLNSTDFKKALREQRAAKKKKARTKSKKK